GFIPYLGDIAKLAKVKKWAGVIERVVQMARADARFGEFVRFGVQKIKNLLDRVPVDRLPGPMREAVESLKTKVDEFFAPSTRVSAPGNRPDLRDTYLTDASVPAHYRNDPRFSSLASDPAHGGKITPKTRAEAMAGLEAETRGLVPGPLRRGPGEIEFYDSQGRPWDVKTPPSPKPGERFVFSAQDTGNSILKELRTKGNPPGTFPNATTGAAEPRRIILDSTYMTPADHKALWQWLNANLTPAELARIVEVNVRP
ncbi:MAG TPA: hypothetical protein VGV38_19790, partial [Pyrinomonadaceae bacterium]|nr:hypothetical protein [Pyrinomonadaceae bacterium]